RAIEAYEDARDRASDSLDQAPLIALAGGLAAGALLAALLPRTRAETRALRPAVRRIRNSANAAVEAARKTGKERFDELGFTREKGEEAFHNLIQGLKDTAVASRDAAVDAVKNQR